MGSIEGKGQAAVTVIAKGRMACHGMVESEMLSPRLKPDGEARLCDESACGCGRSQSRQSRPIGVYSSGFWIYYLTEQ
jgi:hypothetical protein